MSGWTERFREDVNRPRAWPRGYRGNRHTPLVSSGNPRQLILRTSLVALFPALVRSCCSENMLYPRKTSIRS